MQLDKTRIVIRERNWLDILDLALHVLRAYPALLPALAAGAIPAGLFNYWLFGNLLSRTELLENVPLSYLLWHWQLTLIEAPTATAFVTLYLGKALFMDKPKPRELLRQFWQCLPQLLCYQVLVRGIMSLLVITWIVPYLSWPYLNEVILLERNPLRGRRGRDISTYRRSSMLHASNNGDFFLWMLGGAILGPMLVASFWFSLWFLRGMLGGGWEFDRLMYSVALPAAEWLVLGYFAVVRYLGYLDLRIRREGWEVELLLRAERARLVASVA